MSNLLALSSSYNSQVYSENSRSGTVIEESHSSSTRSVTRNADGVTVSLSETSQSYYFKSTVQSALAIDESKSHARQTPRETAQNILDHIGTRLTNAREKGADAKELRSLLKQGHRGVKKGFREAEKTLRHNGQLDKDLKHDIRETRKLVKQGFKELRHEFAPGRRHHHHHHSIQSEAVKANSDLPSTTVQSSSESDLEVSINGGQIADTEETPPSGTTTQVSIADYINFSQSLASANRDTRTEIQGLTQSISATYSRDESALIEIITIDGDIVTIDLTTAIEASKSFSSNGDMEFSLYAENDSSFIIEGSLDEGEWVALNNLLDQVDVLANQFFNGDIATAFEQALSLGFDGDEIASFALEFSQSTTVQATNTYLQTEDSPAAKEQLEKQESIRSLGDYISGLQQALQSAQTFSEPANLLSALLSTVINLADEEKSDQAVDEFNEINDPLIEALDVIEETPDQAVDK